MSRSVLDEIIDGVREDLAEREAATSLDELKTAARRAPDALDPMPAFRADGCQRDRRGQAFQPEQGCARHDRRPRRPRRRLRRGRRRDDQRAHRAAPVRRQPRRPARRTRAVVDVPGAAQGLHRHLLPALGGPRRGCRPGAADRGGARPAEPRRAARARRLHRAHPAGRGARRGGGRARARRRRDAGRRERPQPARPSRSTATRSPGSPRASPTTSSGWPSPGCAGRTTCSSTPSKAPTSSWSARRWCAGDDPRDAVADLVAAGCAPGTEAAR